MQQDSKKKTSRQGCDPLAASGRLELNLGYVCNNRCRFCAEDEIRHSEQAKILQKELTTERVLTRLMQGYKQGFRHVTFLGGEPTLRADFPAIVGAAKKIGYETIFLTSNGRRLADAAYLEKAVAAGLNKIYLSLHGPDSATHDFATQAIGAFGQICQAMENMRKQEVPFNLSSVIYKGNVDKLREMADFQVASGASRLFWALVRPAGAARIDFDAIVPRFEDVDEPLRSAISVIEKAGLPFTVAHMPFCRMAGIEKYVDELYWRHDAVERQLEKPADRREGEGRIQVTSGHRKQKPRDCLRCRYLEICEGVHEEYVKRYGFSEFRPVLGEALKDISNLQDARMLNDD